MKHKWIEEKIMAKEKTFYQWLYLKFYNRKAPPVPVGYRILQTGFKYDNNAPEKNIILNMIKILFLNQWHNNFQPLEIHRHKGKCVIYV